MLRDQTYSKRIVQCWIFIDDVKYDVVNFSAEFSLNSIPTATATIALGRRADLTEIDSSGQAANINEKFLFRKRAIVYASYKIQEESAEIGDLSVPQFESKVVFDGYIAGFGFQRTSNAAVLTVSMEHWLSDLSASTMLSTSTHSATPADLQRAAVMSANPTSGFTAGGKPTFLATSWMLEAAGGSPATICTDLWANGLKKIFEKAASTDNLADLNNKVRFGCADPDSLNQVALDAISRIDSKKAVLNIKLFAADGSDLGNAIIDDLSGVYLENLAGQTIWDCLIACSGNYMFAVIPHVSTAEVVPYCPVAVDEQPFASIPASQIESISIAGDCPRTLRGVAVVFPQTIQPLLGEDEPPLPPDLVMGGVYMSPSAGCKGTVLFKHPPSWLGIGYSYFSSGIDKFATPPTNATPEVKQKTDKKPVGQLLKEFSGVRDAYAKSLYALEVIKGRQGTVSGPLRFDIGVGSQIEFELPADYHSTTSVQQRYFYGVVVRVSFTIDSNSSVASTTFNIAHIRTYAEEYNSDFIMTEHPLYTTKWIGSELDA